MSKLKKIISAQSELSFLQQLIPLIDNKLAGARIYLFGSRARSDYHRRSDVDILVEAEKISDLSWLEINLELENLPTLLNIDLLRADKLDQVFLKHIKNESIRING